MKQFFAILSVLLISVYSASGCMKKSVPAGVSPVTVIVMDTTQALLSDVQVKGGKNTFSTSFDGRVVLKPEQINGAKALAISCEGYNKKRVSLDGSTVLLVQLTPKAGKKPKGGEYHTLGTSFAAKSGVMYRTMGVAPEAVTADFMAVEEAAYETSAETDAAIEKPAIVGYGGAENGVSAGKLTAGEVNDFAKWYFWPKVIDETHKRFVSEWRLTPRHRYTVQVKTKSGAPVVSKSVSLLDNSGNTLFQAVTDNTGKAELWYQLISNNLCGKHAGLRIQVDDQVADAKDWTEGLNTFVLDETCEHSDDVDVVFVFDATGSMGDELRYLQAEMKDVISRASEATGGLNIRTGAVVYRDHGDEYITRLSRLTNNIKTTQDFIDKQEANGGGDYPEAVPEALMAAMNSAGWDANARARVAFLILDAPCHQDSATLALLHEQILNAAALGVRVVPVVCSGLGESGELMLRAMALATNGTSFFLTDDSGIGHPHLKPTTDSLKVEHLNDMLVRTIVEFSTMPACEPSAVNEQSTDALDPFLPNPFSPSEIEADPAIPHGPTTLYIVDITGKLITIKEGELDTFNPAVLQSYGLPTGIYFVKAFYDGKWYTKKVFVR